MLENQMFTEFLQQVTQSGAMALCAFALVIFYKVLTKEGVPSKPQLLGVLSAIVLVLGIGVFLELRRTKYTIEAHSYREAVAQVWFEPYQGRYPMGTQTGLEWDCSDDRYFNDFKGNADYLVHGLWADASHLGCWIKANRNDDGLRIDCVRKGYGVNVTISPRDNKTRLIGPSRNVYLEIYNPCDFEVALRLRIVDERGTHWVWGFERDETKQYQGTRVAIDYNSKDGKNVGLTLRPKENKTFSFPLTRKKWTIFPHDGNTGLPGTSEVFKAIQYVVVEPGIADLNAKKEGLKHRTFLKNNDERTISLVIKNIYLE